VLPPLVFLGGVGVFVVSRLVVLVGVALVLTAVAVVVAWRGGVIVKRGRSEPVRWEFPRIAIVGTSSVSLLSEEELPIAWGVFSKMESQALSRFTVPNSLFLYFTEVLGGPLMELHVLTALDPSTFLGSASGHVCQKLFVLPFDKFREHSVRGTWDPLIGLSAGGVVMFSPLVRGFACNCFNCY